MPSQTNEQALESAIEKKLTGTSLEDLKEQGIPLIIVAERVELYRWQWLLYWLT
jgi:type I restriction enzyme R subunit